MGELVVGKPALQVKAALSLPVDMTSIMSLLYRAVPGSGLDSWLVSARRSMPRQLQEDLDLLHGFTGRLLYFMEEPAMAFEPLREDRLNAPIESFLNFLEEQPPMAFRRMAEHAIDRARQDINLEALPPVSEDEEEWRRYIEPVLTTADAGDVVELLLDPDVLKMRTIRLIRGVWDSFYREEFQARKPALEEAARHAQSIASKGFGQTFSELTGNRLPSTLTVSLNSVASVTFCPSAHLGDFVSYITYPPDVVIFFPMQHVNPNADVFDGEPVTSDVTFVGRGSRERMSGEELLECARAMGDANRLRILDLLGSGELYAQEIVGNLGIAQSAVSRHLSQLERAGLVRVEPRRGMKYYLLDRDQLARLAESIGERAR